MKNYLLIAIFGLVAMLMFQIRFDTVPPDVGKYEGHYDCYDLEQMPVVFDVGKSDGQNQTYYLLNSNLTTAPDLRTIPAGPIRSKPGWKTAKTNEVNKYYKNTLLKLPI